MERPFFGLEGIEMDSRIRENDKWKENGKSKSKKTPRTTFFDR
jgi:hypothetical protein